MKLYIFIVLFIYCYISTRCRCVPCKGRPVSYYYDDDDHDETVRASVGDVSSRD